ncbi:MAG: metallophosphoesterase family protein [Bryobacterales bacterium]|nr:metallophosphoesterase family protein [Bryobacterales bacterium]
MLYLLLSDIHANLEALDAVLADVSRRYPSVDRVLCLGDLVGYGADPELATDRIKAISNVVIRGNHDKAVALGENLDWFNPAARDATYWTLRQLHTETLDYLRNLAKGPVAVNGFQICHGSPLDEDEYIITRGDAEHLDGRLETGIIFFGHTHLQGGFRILRGQVMEIPRPTPHDTESVPIEEDSYYLLNPGSVGQPRDQDPRAAYAVYDSDSKLYTMHRVEYDIASAQRKILDAGLPEKLAFRLSIGR